MRRHLKGRADKLAPDRVSTQLLLDQLRSKIQLAEYEQKAMFEKSEQEKRNNFSVLLTERKKNKLRVNTHGSRTADTHNIEYAFEKKRPKERLFVLRKTMAEAIEIQDNKVCEAIKKYNLKVHEKEEKTERVKLLTEQLELLQQQELQQLEDLNSQEAQQTRVLDNRLEKLKMKYSSAKLISEQYHKIYDSLKEDTQNYPWKLDQLETELLEHQKELAEAIEINNKSQEMVEKSIKGTKKFHEEYFESKKNRDKLLGSTRKKVDKAHKEVKGTDKPKVVRGGTTPNPMQEIINREAEEALLTQQKYEKQRKKRVDYEATASFLKSACKVATKEDILPAITQQHEIQRALRLQIDNLEKQKAVLELEKNGASGEYQQLKYYGEKKISEGVRQREEESDAVEEMKQKVKDIAANIEKKESLLNEINMASNNFFMILQKYKIDPTARQRMTGKLTEDITIIMEKLEEVCDEIEPHGKVAEFLENTEFLDFMEDTLPKANTRVDVKWDEEEGADVFEEEAAKVTSTVLGRDEIKKASQRIIEKYQGKQRRKKAK